MHLAAWGLGLLVVGLSTGAAAVSPQDVNESVVCTCSIAYMRAGIGNDRLVVCLSEYLPLRIVYRISSMSMIAVYFSLRVCFPNRS